jgi:hypothetical protein
MRYRLLVLDVDGTLVGRDQVVPGETIDALRALRAAGLRVCLATGRTYAETVGVWRQLRLRPPYEPLILVGGALVSEPDTGRTLYQRSIPREQACAFADAVGEEGHSAMAALDPWRYGVDYYIARSADAERLAGRWLSQMQVTVRWVERLRDAADMPNPLRVYAVVEPGAAEELARRMQRRFDGELSVHAMLAPNYGHTIVEAFAPRADKWTAAKYVAQGYRIPPRQIVAVGDDVNDVAMVRGAGLGVAMPSAAEAVRLAADRVAVGGLCRFLRELAAGDEGKGPPDASDGR